MSSPTTSSVKPSPKDAAAGKASNDASNQDIGSPEVQAIVDGTIKQTEKRSGGHVNEPEKQAIRDSVEKSAKHKGA